MANAGIASRRESEQLIEDGRVTVNGERITQLPAWVDPFEDRVEVDGEPLIKPKKSSKTFASAGKMYVMVHKPRGVLSTNDDPEGRRRLLDLIDPSAVPRGVRLFPVGRLDADSTGLILMTNDGELTHRLTHPSFGVTKRYLVSVKGRLVEDDLKKLRKGLVLADPKAGKPESPKAGKPGKKASMESVSVLRHEVDRTRGDRTTLAVTLTEGQNREIRRLLAARRDQGPPAQTYRRGPGPAQRARSGRVADAVEPGSLGAAAGGGDQAEEAVVTNSPSA